MRALAAGLIAYGTTGLLILLVVGAGIFSGLDRVEGLSRTVEEQRASITSALAAADLTMGSTGSALDGVNDSLADAQVSLTRVAGLATELSSTMGALASALNVSILGSQPFAGASEGFTNTALQLDSLAGEVSTTSASIGSNATDVAAVGTQVTRLQAAVADIREGLAGAPDTGVTGTDLGVLRLVIGALVAWLAVQAVAAVAAGSWLLRRDARRRVARRARKRDPARL
ncbi:MAG: hypothetical protein ABIZ34_06470 [Candidatus Limnocylindrales bacterium]